MFLILKLVTISLPTCFELVLIICTVASPLIGATHFALAAGSVVAAAVGAAGLLWAKAPATIPAEKTTASADATAERNMPTSLGN